MYFCVDDALLYNAFHHDFGPLHIGHLYKFAITFHDILGAPKHENRVVVFWSRPDVKARANAACLLACYMVSDGWRVMMMVGWAVADGIVGSGAELAAASGTFAAVAVRSSIGAVP